MTPEDAAPTSPGIRAAVHELARAGRPLLVLSDFDGTLSSIVLEADRASIVPLAREALRRLVAVDGVTIAILSGRGAEDVATRTGVPGARVLGEHGIEEVRSSGDPVLDPAAEAAGREIARAAEEVADRLGRPSWLWIERKRAASGIHYRHAADPAAARVAILDAIGDRHPDVAVLESRRIVELRPSFATGKDAATERLLADASPAAVIVLGDDRTDVAMFRSVARWRRAAAGRTGLIVGVRAGAESPPEVAAAADLMVDGPEESAALLAELADAVTASQA